MPANHCVAPCPDDRADHRRTARRLTRRTTRALLTGLALAALVPATIAAAPAPAPAPVQANAAAPLPPPSPAPPLLAEPAPLTSGPTARPSFDCASTGVSGLSRERVLVRARRWVAFPVPYDQSACGSDGLGGVYRTDCSGFVSLSWGLGRSYTTSDFISDTSLWSTIAYSALRPADALVARTSTTHHVMLFTSWANLAHTRVNVYEQTPPQTRASTYDVATLIGKGYHPIRYTRLLVDRSAPAMLYGSSGSSSVLYRWDSAVGHFTPGGSPWASTAYPSASVGNRLVTGDFTGDGYADIAAASGTPGGGLRIDVWSRGQAYLGTWYDAGPFPLNAVAGRMVAGDFNRDGKADIALLASAGGSSTGAAVWRLLSTGRRFTAATPMWQQDSGFDLAAVGDRVVSGDFTGDGTDDLAAVYQRSDSDPLQVYVWSAAAAAPSVRYTSTAVAMSAVGARVVAGDFDGDQRADLAFLATRGTGATLWRLLSQADGSAVATATWTVAAGYDLTKVAGRLAAGDVNGDGRADLVDAYQMPDGTFRNHVWTGAVTYSGAAGWYASGVFPLSKVGDRLVAGAW